MTWRWIITAFSASASLVVSLMVPDLPMFVRLFIGVPAAAAYVVSLTS